MKSRFSLSLGKPFGIKVSVHWTFSLLIVWIIFVTVRQGLEPVQILMHILFVLAIFACVLLHEFGHSLTAVKLGGKVQGITLLPIGGMANITEMPETPKDEFIVSAAGPLVNIVIAGILWEYLRDPRIYTRLANEFPGRIESIYIRKIRSKVFYKNIEQLNSHLEKVNTSYLQVEDTMDVARHALSMGYVNKELINELIQIKDTKEVRI